MKSYLKLIFVTIILVTCLSASGQQDPQFTQYMYNTMSVNPAYAGNRGHLSVLGMYRTQWVGINGAPTNQLIAIDGSVGKNLGLGVVLTNDELGPSKELFFDANISYTIRLDGGDKKLSFGLKGGGRLFNVDFSKGLYEDPDLSFQNNIENKFFPTIGTGVYYHSRNSYFGFAIPNFFSQEHYNGSIQHIAVERLHYYVIGGRVFDLDNNVKFKPAFFLKWVPGAPMIADISANFLIKNTLTLGAAYRWDDSFSGLLGIDISPKFHVGYAYDMATTDLNKYNSGTHEIFLRFELKSLQRRLKSPRFY